MMRWRPRVWNQVTTYTEAKLPLVLTAHKPCWNQKDLNVTGNRFYNIFRKLSVLILVSLSLAGVSGSPCCVSHMNCHFQYVIQNSCHEKSFTKTFGLQSGSFKHSNWKGWKGGCLDWHPFSLSSLRDKVCRLVYKHIYILKWGEECINAQANVLTRSCTEVQGRGARQVHTHTCTYTHAFYKSRAGELLFSSVQPKQEEYSAHLHTVHSFDIQGDRRRINTQVSFT